MVRHKIWIQLKTAKVHRLKDLHDIAHRFVWMGKENNYAGEGVLMSSEEDSFRD